MDAKVIALIGVAGLIAGALMPLAPALGYDGSHAQAEAAMLDVGRGLMLVSLEQGQPIGEPEN